MDARLHAPDAILDHLPPWTAEPEPEPDQGELLALRSTWAPPARPAPAPPSLPTVFVELARLGYRLVDRGYSRMPRWQLQDRSGRVLNTMAYPDHGLAWAHRARARAVTKPART